MDAANDIHDAILDSNKLAQFNDKQLHFIIIGIIGIHFATTHTLFKWLQGSITAISFIYTMTVLIVLVFVIEIQQSLQWGKWVDDMLQYIVFYLFIIYLFMALHL